MAGEYDGEAIRGFAEEQGIAPGIIVGSLQHGRVLPWNRLNCLEARPDAPAAEGSLIEREWKGAQGLAEDVRYYVRWMRDEAEKRIGHPYPKVEVTAEMARERPDLERYAGRKLTVIAWLWARTVKSPNPAFRDVDAPLATTFMLSTRKGKEAYVEPVIEGGGYRFTVKAGAPETGVPEHGAPGTGASEAEADIPKHGALGTACPSGTRASRPLKESAGGTRAFPGGPRTREAPYPGRAAGNPCLAAVGQRERVLRSGGSLRSSTPDHERTPATSRRAPAAPCATPPPSSPPLRPVSEALPIASTHHRPGARTGARQAP